MNDDSFKFFVAQSREQYMDLKEDIRLLEKKVEDLQHFKSKLAGMAAVAIVISELVIQGIEHLK